METPRQRRQLLQLLLALGLPALPARARGTSLRVVSSHLPPLVVEKGDRHGALYEIVSTLLQRMDAGSAIEFLPWSRVTWLAAHGPRTVAFPLTRSDEREHKYRWLAQVYEEHFVFIVRRGQFDVRQPELLRTRPIALLRGSAMVSILHQKGYKHIVEANSTEEYLRFLERGMVDAAFGDVAIVQAALMAHHDLASYELSAPIHSTTAWLGGSLDIGEEEAARYRQAMAAMHEDGSVARILQKYGLLK